MSTATTRTARNRNIRPISQARYYIAACVRCRQKKKRCDQKLPRCGLCESAGAECVSYDAETRRHVPRSYVHSLEEHVAYLELKLREHGIPDREPEDNYRPTDALSLSEAVQTSQSSPMEVTAIGHSPRAIETDSSVAAKATLDIVLSLVQRSSRDEPAFSKILLAELLKSKTTPLIVQNKASEQALIETQLPFDMVSDLDASQISLPSKEAAQNLVKAYFQFTNVGMPLLHEPTFRKKLDLLYSMPEMVDLAKVHTSTESRIAIFFVFEVFAVAILIMQKEEPSKIPTSLADRYHKAALRSLNEAGLPSDIEGVQALLLIGQYSYHHPTVWEVWKTIGAALRLAVELGLHQDPPPDRYDFLTLDTMRRVFWVAYSMDRNVSIALAMPSCLSDGAITAKFPSQANDEFITPDGITTTNENYFGGKFISTHLFRYRQIQSEMQTILYERQYPAYHPLDLCQWQQYMHGRIQEWYDTIPRINTVTNYIRRDLENFELTYHRALLYLYHPSLSIPNPPESALVAIMEAATRMIQLYRQFFCEHRLTIYWQAVENLSSAGTALIFSYVNSSEVQKSLNLRSLETLVHTCSSVLWGMVEHFPAFKGKRDVFDLIASKTLADLAANSTLADREEHSPVQDKEGTGEHSEYQMGTEVRSSAALHGRQQLSFEPTVAIQPGFGSTSTAASDPRPTQNTQTALPTTGSESNIDATDTPFLLSIFDDTSYDWDAAIENRSNLWI